MSFRIYYKKKNQPIILISQAFGSVAIHIQGQGRQKTLAGSGIEALGSKS